MVTTSDHLNAATLAMPDPASGRQARAYESELAAWFGVRHAIAVSSGTAALHCCLIAAGIGRGDEVLVPAAAVVMSVAPVLYAGAVPVFVDSPRDGFGLDLDDLAAKTTPRTRAVLPVHLWGRVGNLDQIHAFAQERSLLVIEDACQAVGTRHDGRLAGTWGQMGCLSTKDGKILWSGEGGVVLTDDAQLAHRCAAFRTHWQDPAYPDAAEVGHNYRLAEPLAAIARDNLARLDDAVALRQQQTELLTSLAVDTPGLHQQETELWEDHNGYAPTLRITLDKPRAFCDHLAQLGVPNSVGTFGLRAADQRGMFAPYAAARPCSAAAEVIDHTLAPILTEHTTTDDVRTYAEIIHREAQRWP